MSMHLFAATQFIEETFHLGSLEMFSLCMFDSCKRGTKSVLNSFSDPNANIAELMCQRFSMFACEYQTLLIGVISSNSG